MASRGQSVTISYVAWNTSGNSGEQFDAANHVLRLVKDGTSAAPTNAPSEVDSTNAPGVYKLTLTGSEATYNVVTLSGKSSTANVVIIPITISFELLPTLPPGTAGGGLSILDSNGNAPSDALFFAGYPANVDDNLLPTVSVAGWADALVDALPQYFTNLVISPTGSVQATDLFGQALATFASVQNIAVTGAALNATAASATYTSGTDAGGVADTYSLDGVYDAVTAGAGTTIDCYYQFSLGSTGQAAVGVTWWGYLSTSGHSAKVYAWNWGNSAWDQVGSVAGVSTVAISQVGEFELTNSHTGTGGNVGLVRLRFYGTGLLSSTVLYTDRILCGYAVTPTAPPTAATIATTIWQDLTNGDFTTVGSPGYILVKQLGGIFVTNTSSVIAAAALVNAPSGGGGGGAPVMINIQDAAT